MINKYRIYEIPTYVWKDGRIGKVGCTVLSIEHRGRQLGYSDIFLLESHDDINIADIREIELQKQKGYRVDSMLYSESVANRFKMNSAVATKIAAIKVSNGTNYGPGSVSKSEEHKRKISEALTGIPQGPHSTAAKLKMSLARKEWWRLKKLNNK